MNIHNLDTQRHGHAVYHRAADHGPDSAGSVGLLPEHPQNKYPHKGGLQTSEGKHIDLPDHVRRIDGDEEDDQSQYQRAHLAECAGSLLRDLLLTLLLFVHVNVLNDGGCGCQQQGGNRRDGRGDRSDDGDACHQR